MVQTTVGNHFFSNIFDRLYVFMWAIIRIWQGKTSDSVRCLNGRTAIVTGGNMGIGFQTCLLLASRGCKVIIADCCDSTEAVKKIVELTGNRNISSRKLDLSSLKSVREFAESVKRDERKIDILINNAGVASLRQKKTDDGLNPLMQINYFGHFLLTHLLIDLLKSSKGARIVFMASELYLLQNLTVENLNMTDFEHNTFTIFTNYGNSKFAVILAAQELARKLGKFGIQVNVADPGVSKTTIFQKGYKEQDNPYHIIIPLSIVIGILQKSPWHAAQSSFHLATSDKLEGNGKVYTFCKEIPKLKILQNEQYCQAIWEKTEELVQLLPNEKL